MPPKAEPNLQQTTEDVRVAADAEQHKLVNTPKPIKMDANGKPILEPNQRITRGGAIRTDY